MLKRTLRQMDFFYMLIILPQNYEFILYRGHNMAFLAAPCHGSCGHILLMRCQLSGGQVQVGQPCHGSCCHILLMRCQLSRG